MLSFKALLRAVLLTVLCFSWVLKAQDIGQVTIGIPKAKWGYPYTLESSVDLVHWQEVPEMPTFDGDELPHAAVISTGGATHLFFRWVSTDPAALEMPPTTVSNVQVPTPPVMLNPLNPDQDSDEDGYTDAVERMFGTDPYDADDNPAKSGKTRLWMEKATVFTYDNWQGHVESVQNGVEKWWVNHARNVGAGDLNDTTHSNGSPNLPGLMTPPNPTTLPGLRFFPHENLGFRDGSTPIATVSFHHWDDPSSKGKEWSAQYTVFRLRSNLPLPEAYSQGTVVTTYAESLDEDGTIDVESTAVAALTIPKGKSVSNTYTATPAPADAKVKVAWAGELSVSQPTLDADGNVTGMSGPRDELRLGRWHTAFYQDTEDQNKWKPKATDFIPDDPDRVEITVEHDAAIGNTITMQVSTVTEEGQQVDAGDVTLTKLEGQPEGGLVRYRGYVYLVADDADKTYTEGTAYTSVLLKAKLGGTLKTTTANMPGGLFSRIMKKKMTKKVSWTFVDSNSDPFFPTAYANNALEVINEAYSQIGVQFEKAQGDGVRVVAPSTLPQDVRDVLNGPKEFKALSYIDQDSEGATREEISLYNALSTFNGDIEIICVKAAITRPCFKIGVLA